MVACGDGSSCFGTCSIGYCTVVSDYSEDPDPCGCVECLVDAHCPPERPFCEVDPPGFGIPSCHEFSQHCRDHADCYASDRICDRDEGTCLDLPEAWTRCDAASGAVPKDRHGPLLSGAVQTNLGSPAVPGPACAKAPETCVNNGNVCGFAVTYHDPEGDLPAATEDFYGLVLAFGPSGEASRPYEVRQVAGSSFSFSLCLDEAVSSIAAAVQLRDLEGNHSNPLCLEGVAP